MLTVSLFSKHSGFSIKKFLSLLSLMFGTLVEIENLMDHCVFRFATRWQCIKGKKLDCFEHNHIFCFNLECASIVVLLCTAIWWKIKGRSGPFTPLVSCTVHKYNSSFLLNGPFPASFFFIFVFSIRS